MRAPRISRPALNRDGGVVQLVVTPGSGEGVAMLTARRLATRLKRRGHVVDVHVFHDLDELTRWADTCPPGASSIVCMGGTPR